MSRRGRACKGWQSCRGKMFPKELDKRGKKGRDRVRDGEDEERKSNMLVR